METTTTALLDRWKQAKGLGSDYAAAKALGVSQGTLSNWRHGRSHADVELAAKMAEALGLDTLGTLAAIQADRETRPGAAAVWRRYGKGAFMALALGLSVGLSSTGNALRPVGMEDVSRPYAHIAVPGLDARPAAPDDQHRDAGQQAQEGAPEPSHVNAGTRDQKGQDRRLALIRLGQ